MRGLPQARIVPRQCPGSQAASANPALRNRCARCLRRTPPHAGCFRQTPAPDAVPTGQDASPPLTNGPAPGAASPPDAGPTRTPPTPPTARSPAAATPRSSACPTASTTARPAQPCTPPFAVGVHCRALRFPRRWSLSCWDRCLTPRNGCVGGCGGARSAGEGGRKNGGAQAERKTGGKARCQEKARRPGSQGEPREPVDPFRYRLAKVQATTGSSRLHGAVSVWGVCDGAGKKLWLLRPSGRRLPRPRPGGDFARTRARPRRANEDRPALASGTGPVPDGVGAAGGALAESLPWRYGSKPRPSPSPATV
jgi:hypothetical protein